MDWPFLYTRTEDNIYETMSVIFPKNSLEKKYMTQALQIQVHFF